jgi:MFS family permease
MAGTLIYYALAAFGGPGLGPVVAAFIDERAGWRWNMRVQAIFVAVMTVACILLVPKTEKAAAVAVKESKAAEREKLKRVFKRAFKGPFVWLIQGA